MVRIKETREKFNISQATLVAKLGWGQGRVSNYERAERTPPLKVCRAIVTALNDLGATCTLDDVFPPDLASSVSCTTSATAPPSAA